MLYQNLVEGGLLFMLPIYILWVVVIALNLALIYRLAVKKTGDSKRIKELILFLGSLAFLWGILGQVTGMIQALACVEAVGDISPALIAGGFKVSLLAPVYGFVLFIFSFVSWFAFRRLDK
jgi:hypothetical protein